jgi:hypothetical protein
MREWRKTRPIKKYVPSASLSLPALQQRRAQGLASKHKQRGHLLPQPCQVCGNGNPQMHHADYTRPLEVTWLCSACHADWHVFWRELSGKAFTAWFASAKAAISGRPIDPGELAEAQLRVR